VKYDSSGAEVWKALYNYNSFSWDCIPSLLQGEDAPVAIGLDAEGNVYVTGTTSYRYCCGENHFYEAQVCTTVKYNPSGSPMWTHFAGDDFDPVTAAAMAVDNAGNVHAVANENGNFLTMKYGGWFDLWTARYTGPRPGDNRPTDIAVDAIGHVYVTGSSRGDGSGNDYVTIKYDPEGEELWVARFDGTSGSNDHAEAVALGVFGFVYVAGNSDGDIATAAYNSSGDSIWVARYVGAGDSRDDAVDIVADASGGVFVAGTSEGPGSGTDILTIKYDWLGNQIWEQHYDGPAGGDDQADSVTLTASGDVVVTGVSEGPDSAKDFVTLCYGAISGAELWRNRYNGPASGEDTAPSVAPDVAGNVIVTGTSQGIETALDYATIKYDPDGTAAWLARFENPDTGGGGETPAAMALDPWGNIIVTGTRCGYASPGDYTTVKYDPEGNQLWVRNFEGPAGGSDGAMGLAVDRAGNILVTGGSEGAGTESDYLTVKYDPDGVEVWVARYDGPEGGMDTAGVVVVDSMGNAYVTGSSEGPGTEGDALTIKYDPDGNEIWTARYNGPANAWDRGVSLAVDGHGNVYITASSTGDYATIKYGPNGNEVWAARYNGPDGREDVPVALVLDTAGNVFVTGSSEGDATRDDFLTVKYDPDGSEVWTARLSTPGGCWDNPTAMAVDASGDVYITGQSGGCEYRSITVKYGPDGSELWSAVYDSHDLFRPTAIVLDPSRSAYITGSLYNYPYSACGDPRGDFLTLKYDWQGTQVWEILYDGPFIGFRDDGSDSPAALVLDGSGDLYVTGRSESQGTGYDFATIKYTHDLTCHDLDGDGYGSPGTPECMFPETDCDDTDPAINPGNPEDTWPECHNGIDEDCDGYEDTLFYNSVPYFGCWCSDWDGDGHGGDYGPESVAGCAYPEEDCDDEDGNTYPGAPEVCDGADNQCAGDAGHCRIDEGCPCALLAPEDGAVLVDPPILEWTACGYDLFGLYLLVPILDYYYILPVWSPCSFADLGEFDPLWSAIGLDRWTGWGVLSVNHETGDLQWRGWRWFRKAEP
jgi:uncharacterized delta-60 repeat protein